ncbi:MAG: PQQ-dependent sugar dehydrogenase [Proteobacteria bacterium]|nr:PQQ-dependent sugar dehydrogenase [Pseudomonadota bacterium]
MSARIKILFSFVICALLEAPSAAPALMLEHLKLPTGFSASVFASDIPNARQMAKGDRGVLFVGSRSAGNVYAVLDADEDHHADRVVVIARNLYMPSGVAYRNGTLYVAEVNRIVAFDDIERNLEAPPEPRVVYDRLPDDSHHGWKFIDFGSDDKLYFAVGAPCNVCSVDDPYGTIQRLDISDGTTEVVARGVRNTVGFAWHPVTDELWFTDNGRDMMGDDMPPGEINRISEIGQHFGFPFVHGGTLRDPEFGQGASLDNFIKPAYALAAHVAPLGPLFYVGHQFPKEYQGNLFIAEHGSWNRSRKSGYRVMRAQLDPEGNIARYEPFITGWLLGEAHWGRPVAMVEWWDGSILVSDDYAGVIYRISYKP